MGGRTLCTYASEFIQQPLDGVTVNRELGELFHANAVRGSRGGTDGPKLPLSSDTTTRSSYIAPKPKKGKEENFKPDHVVHVDPSSHFLETRSVFQRDFGAFNPEQRRMGRAESVKPNSGRTSLPAIGGGALSSFEGVSSYHRDFASGNAVEQSRANGRRSHRRIQLPANLWRQDAGS